MPDTLQGVDDLIRSGLEAYRESWFHCLLASTGLVVAGLVLEAFELVPELIFMVRRKCRERNWGIALLKIDIPEWLKIVAFCGWFLVVAGVAGEFVSDSFFSSADGLIQKFDEILLADAQRKTGFVSERAALAIERAASNEKEAASLRIENTQLEAIIQPRTISIENQQKIAEACSEFKGHGAVVQSYGLDTEGFATGSQIIAVLQTMKVIVADDRASTVSTGRMEIGIHVRTTDASEIPFASCIWGALNNIAKLATAFNDPPPPFRGAMFGGGGQSINGPHIMIMVGTKPLPLLTDKQRTTNNK